MDSKKAMVFDLAVDKDKYIFPSSISETLVEASDELKNLNDRLNETLDTIEDLTLNCKKEDYHIRKALVVSNEHIVKTEGKITYLPIYDVMLF